MARLPVRQDEHARAQLAYDAGDLQPVLVGVFHPAIRNVERPPPADSQDSRGLAGFARAVFDAAACAHFALREVEDGGAIAAPGHLQQRAAASLLHIVAMRGDGQDVGLGVVGHPVRASFSPILSPKEAKGWGTRALRKWRLA